MKSAMQDSSHSLKDEDSSSDSEFEEAAAAVVICLHCDKWFGGSNNR